MVTLLRTVVFGDVTPCGPEKVYQRFSVFCRLFQRVIIRKTCIIFMVTAVRTSDFINIFTVSKSFILIGRQHAQLMGDRKGGRDTGN